MNRYLSTMSEPIRTNRGIIDKYIGDGIMAYWGPPFALRRELLELLGVRGTPIESCDLRIGVATGEALVGSIGSDVMMSYTVMGDVVNLASRLEGANKVYGTRNLVAERTVAASDAAVEVREIDRIEVAGYTHSEVVFEILGRKGELTPQQLSSRDRYLEGLAAYRAQRWDDAFRALNASLQEMPGDGPSTVLLKRVESHKANPPSKDWDGSWRIDK
jgi:adenylate cyclase